MSLQFCFLSGLDRFEARKKLWADLEEAGLAVMKESYTSRVPRSQRGGEVRDFRTITLLPFGNTIYQIKWRYMYIIGDRATRQ